MKYKIIFEGKVTEQSVSFALRDEFGRDVRVLEMGVDNISGNQYAVIEAHSSIPEGALKTLSVKGVSVAEVILMINEDNQEEQEDVLEESPVEEEPKEESEEKPAEEVEEKTDENPDEEFFIAKETFRIPGTTEIIKEGMKFKIIKE